MIDMNKNLLIFGVSVLLICVSLSGCNENLSNKDNESFRSDITLISDINLYPNRYINKTVTVKAIGAKLSTEHYFLIDNEQPANINAYVNSSIDTSIVIGQGLYYWTGIVRYQIFELFSYNTETLYIEISMIQPV